MLASATSCILNTSENDSSHILPKSNGFPFDSLVNDPHIQLWNENILVNTQPRDENTALLNLSSPKVSDGDCCKTFFSHHGKIYSIYTFVAKNLVFDAKTSKPYMDCLIAVANGQSIAIGRMRRNMLVKHSVITTPPTTRDDNSVRLSEEALLTKTIEELEKCWKTSNPNRIVVVSSAMDVKGKSLKKAFEARKYQIEYFPLRLTNISKSEILSTYQRLMQCTSHGNAQYFLELIHPNQNNRKFDPFVPKSPKSRKLELCKFPTLTKTLKRQLHSALLTDNYHLIIQIYEDERLNPEILDYLSFKHDKLAGSTFLHYAVSNNLCETVKAFLEIGCDFDGKDVNGSVSLELCKTAEMAQVFIEFSEENPDVYEWTKIQTFSTRIA
ncbi:unnamed protein product [Auanema sp. JU1783]|nr:unnamed protein product [Auanema sp. JU1783]